MRTIRNSFAPPFFLPLSAVAAAVTGPAGHVSVDTAAAEALLKAEPRCQRCGATAPNFPRFKEHVAACAAPLAERDDLGGGGEGGA